MNWSVKGAGGSPFMDMAPTVTPRLVDEATGAPRQFILEFVKWANLNIWGPMEEQPNEPS